MAQSKTLTSEERRKKMEEILFGMQVKLGEIESIRNDVYREKLAAVSGTQTAAMLEEITVPQIEMLRDEKRKKTQ